MGARISVAHLCVQPAAIPKAAPWHGLLNDPQESLGWHVAVYMLAGLEAQPTVTQVLFMRRIAEAWLEGQRREYGKGAISP